MHIAIEGMDGVGKTTAAKNLAEKLNYIIVEKPLHYMLDTGGDHTNYIRIRDYINGQVGNHALRAWFYGLGNIFLYYQYRGKDIITDRHFVSNYFWCGYEETECIFRCMVELIGKPDITILLYASPEEGARRIHRRDPHDSDIQKTIFYAEAKQKMESYLVRYDMEHIAIDTTEMTADGVVERMIARLPAMFKRHMMNGCDG